MERREKSISRFTLHVSRKMNRRQFLNVAAGATVWGIIGTCLAEKGAMQVNASHLPRWRGFNLLEKFTDSHNAPFRESDFAWMAEWGFDFARLPLSYRCWADVNDWLNLREETLKEIDQAVAFGRQYGVHVPAQFPSRPRLLR